MIRPVMPLATGARLGPFEILGPLGADGMGRVYRARDTRLARDVAEGSFPRRTSESDPSTGFRVVPSQAEGTIVRATVGE